jgi:hypothetical protein
MREAETPQTRLSQMCVVLQEGSGSRNQEQSLQTEKKGLRSNIMFKNVEHDNNEKYCE